MSATRRLASRTKWIFITLIYNNATHARSTSLLRSNIVVATRGWGKLETS